MTDQRSAPPDGRNAPHGGARSGRRKHSEAASAPSVADVAAISALAEIVAHHDLTELELDRDGMRLRLARLVAPARPAEAIDAAPRDVNPKAAEASIDWKEDEIGAEKSPMAGIAYLRAAPEASPFVEIGQVVKPGDKLLLIEADAVFHEIAASRSATIARVLVEDGSPVEFGQALMTFE